MEIGAALSSLINDKKQKSLRTPTPKRAMQFKTVEKREVKLFKNDFIVEGGSGQSSQAYVFFGREKSL